MKRYALPFVFLLLLASAARSQEVPAWSEPAVSPDGAELAFTSGGDIWTAPIGGGEARLLVSDPAMESRPSYSPDGSMLAFVSTRSGNGDIYVLDLRGGDIRRITWDDGGDRLDGWSGDGKWLYFSSTSRDIAGMNDIWRVSPNGGTPMQVTAERYVNEYFSAPSPDGQSLAFAARGIPSAQWWRNGHSHIDESQIWILRRGQYEPVTADGAKEIWPMWSADGKTIYYVSDRSGAENIWSISSGGQAPSPVQITKFTTGRVLWPAISNDGRTIVFERDFGIWKLDTGSGSASEVRIARRGAPSAAPVERRRVTDRFNYLALSPDGKKVVFTARGDLFAAAVKEAGDAVRLTNTPALESQVIWTTDSRSVIYVSDRDGRPHLFQYDFSTEREKQLTTGEVSDDTPQISPDGKQLAFIRNAAALMALDLGSNQTRTIAPARFIRQPLGSDRTFVWSPDSRWLAYLTFGDSMFRNVSVVPTSGGAARTISFLPNVFAETVAWSPDGKFVLMTTGQRTETGRLARIDLTPTTPAFREDQFRDLFRDSPRTEEKAGDSSPSARLGMTAEKKAAPVEIDFAGIRERLRLLPVGLDADDVTISPDGKWIAFRATIGDDENVYVYSIDELATDPAVPKQLSSTSGRKTFIQFSPDSKEVFYLDAGKITAATIDPARTRPIAVGAEMDIDFAREKGEAFHQAWTWLRDNFYDPAMHGVDWVAVRNRFAPRVAAARTPDEFRRLLSLMVGELNASHLGANPPADQIRQITGRIGVRFDRDEYERSGRLKVSEVLPLSPADVAKIRAGEIIVAVDGNAITPSTNFDRLLEYRNGKRVVVSVSSDGTARRDVTLQPVRNADEKGLTYRAWVNANRDYVHRVSGGRLGYVHMIDMSSNSLGQLFIDLDAENRAREGVVIDIRNNNGGFVNVYAIDVLSRRPYLTMTFRDFAPAPARTVLGQRSLEKPTVLVTNRHSLSDAEDLTEGYRALKLGKVVGEPTAGWIIYTSNVNLIDGTVFRLPFIRITDGSGKDMERNPRAVDRFVQRPIGESYAGKDSQLDAAVQELLSELKK